MAVASEAGSIAPHPGVLSGSLRLLASIEDLPAGATGALRFGGEGMVLVESRLVCWAIASGMEQRLTELLRQQRNPPIERSVLEQVVRECSAQGRPLGEALVSSGQVTPEGLRRALFRQTADAIAQIASSGATCDGFVPHVRARYDARFVFPTAEILASLGARRQRAVAAAARAALSKTLVLDSIGLAFVHDEVERDPVVVSLVGAAKLRVTDVLAIGRWARCRLAVAREIDPDARIVTASWGGASSVVCWQSGEPEFVALCKSRAASARIVASLSATMGGGEPST